jgi:hypothetical protein
MNRSTRIIVAALATIPLGGVSRPTAAIADEPVAIVCFLSGTGHMTVDRKRTELDLFQRLRSGAAIEVAKGSRMVLALFTGDRFEFAAMSSATLAPTGLVRRQGPIRELPPVPAIVEIAPIVKEERAGGRMAGTRIRAGNTGTPSIGHVEPSNGAAVVAASAVVGFDPVPGYERYRVTVEDDRGNAVFSIDTVDTVVRLPPTALAAGGSYYWSVHTLDGRKPVVGAEAVFRTLSDEDARRRAEFKSHVDRAGDAMSYGLLAEVDRSLGLRREACDALKRALDLDPGYARLSGAVERFACTRK